MATPLLIFHLSPFLHLIAIIPSELSSAIVPSWKPSLISPWLRDLDPHSIFLSELTFVFL